MTPERIVIMTCCAGCGAESTAYMEMRTMEVGNEKHACVDCGRTVWLCQETGLPIITMTMEPEPSTSPASSRMLPELPDAGHLPKSH